MLSSSVLLKGEVGASFSQNSAIYTTEYYIINLVKHKIIKEWVFLFFLCISLNIILQDEVKSLQSINNSDTLTIESFSTDVVSYLNTQFLIVGTMYFFNLSQDDHLLRPVEASGQKVRFYLTILSMVNDFSFRQVSCTMWNKYYVQLMCIKTLELMRGSDMHRTA